MDSIMLNYSMMSMFRCLAPILLSKWPIGVILLPKCPIAIMFDIKVSNHSYTPQ